MRALMSSIPTGGLTLLLAMAAVVATTMVVLDRPILAAPLVALPLALVALRRIEWVGYVVIAVALTRADAWISTWTGVPAGSLNVIGVVGAVILVVLFTDRRMSVPTAPFYSIVLFYLTAFLVGALFSDTTHAGAWIRDGAYALIAFTVVYLFTSDEGRLRNACRMIVICGALLAITNVVELFIPALNLSHSEGRAAGLLKNANTSAFVLACSYVVLQLYQRWERSMPPALLTTLQILFFAGVLATMSRGGMMLMMAAVGVSLLVYNGKRRRVLSAVLATGVTGLLIFFSIDYLQRSADVSFLLSLQKVSTFFSGEIDDNHRFYLARYYFMRFLEKPFVGYGFYATVLPSAANTDMSSFFGVKGPHNTPITMLAEFGFLPFLCYASFYAASLLRIRKVGDAYTRHHLLLLLAIIAAHNIFAHDVHLARAKLVMLALLAAAPEALSLNPAAGTAITQRWRRRQPYASTRSKEC